MKSVDVTLVIAFVAASLFLSSSVQAQQASSSPFAGITQAQQICGPRISPDSLRGKIVFVEYWGTRCPPCRQSMPHLQEMYNQLGKTGLFCIIGNHVQQYTSDTDKFLKDTGVTFPVYQHLNLPINKNITSIPRAFLFDVSGKIVAEGHPLEIVNRIPDLVQEALILKKTETLHALDSSKVPNEFKRPFTHSDLRDIQNTALAMSTPGKTWQENYKTFQKSAQFNRTSKKQSASSVSDKRLNDETLRLIELSKTEPAKAYNSIKKRYRLVKGTGQEQELVDAFRPLTVDKNIKELSIILKNIENFNSQSEQMTSEAAQKKAQELFESLKTFCGKQELSLILKKEAYAAAWELKQKYGNGSADSRQEAAGARQETVMISGT